MINSPKLAKFRNLIHGFTTREEGDFKKTRDFKKRDWGKSRIQMTVHICDTRELILPEQIHGDKIAVVSAKDRSKIIRGVDGLITQEKGLLLGVTTADCLPILFFEPEKKIIAVVHAGWRGTLKKICPKMIQKIVNLGGDPSKIIATIGPHIKKCCYEIEKKRELIFTKEFGQRVIDEKEGRFFLDLTKINLIQLSEVGLKEEKIEVSPFCTYCHHHQFFSYRKEKENYGEMLTFIGLK